MAEQIGYMQVLYFLVPPFPNQISSNETMHHIDRNMEGSGYHSYTVMSKRLEAMFSGTYPMILPKLSFVSW